MKRNAVWPIVAISAAATLFLAGRTEDSASKTPLLDEIDVNGLVVNEACDAVREAGWKVEEVEGSGDRTEKSDCSDSERKVVNAWFVNVDDEDYESLAGTVTLKFANEAKEAAATPEPSAEPEPTTEPEPTAEPAPEVTTETPAVDASGGYQAIFDVYSARLQNECPALSIMECAELNNEGVSQMAEYMYKASGTDGQYATYETWASQLMDVYMASAQ